MHPINFQNSFYEHFFPTDSSLLLFGCQICSRNTSLIFSKYSSQYPGHNTIRCFKYGYPYISSPKHHCFVILLFLDSIILHTFPNEVPYFWIKNHHQKLSLYQRLVLFHVDLPPHGINLPVVLIIICKNIFSEIISIILNHDNLFHIKVGVPLFPFLSLQHIGLYIPNKIRAIKNRQICKLFKKLISFVYSNPSNSK